VEKLTPFAEILR